MKKKLTYPKIFMKKNKINFIISLVICVADSLMNVWLAFLMSDLLDIAAGGMMQELITCISKVGIYILMYVIVLLSKRKFVNAYIKKAMMQYKNLVFQNILKKDINAFTKEGSGQYISMFTNDMETIESSYVHGRLEMIIQIASFITGLLAMLYLNPVLTIAVVAFSLLPIFLSAMFTGSLIRSEKEVSEQNGAFVNTVKDIFTGFSVVKTFQAECKIEKLFVKSNLTIENSKNGRRRATDFVKILMGVSNILVSFVIFGGGAYFALRGKISAGTVIAFVQLLNYVLGPLSSLGQLTAEFKASRVLIEKMEKETLPQEETKAKITQDFHHAICVNKVSFGYEEGKDILKGIEVTFEKNKSYALVGASGSGKSTLLNLLQGYSDNYRGEITIDQTELRRVSKESLYQLLSVIQQNVFIFDQSIQNNMTLFQDYPQEKLDRTIESASLSNLIQEKGLDYECGEAGKNLSGGERQRISIARGLLRDTPVLLMDEATSALDPETAMFVEQEIARLQNLTRIVITHRLDEHVLNLYDEIVVLKDGKVCEKGTYQELVEKQGYFSSLIHLEEKDEVA